MASLRGFQIAQIQEKNRVGRVAELVTRELQLAVALSSRLG